MQTSVFICRALLEDDCTRVSILSTAAFSLELSSNEIEMLCGQQSLNYLLSGPVQKKFAALI